MVDIKLENTIKNFRKIIVLIVLSILLASCPKFVEADDVHNLNDYYLSAYSAAYFEVYLNENEGMAGWFRITNGDGFTFFIVDYFGHQQIQTTGSTLTTHKLKEYTREEGRWYYWNFIANDTDHWYVYFSKAFGTTYAGTDAELDIIIRKDTQPPSISVSIDSGILSGQVDIGFTVIDDCFPVKKVEFFVDNIIDPIKTILNPNLETGYVFESNFFWDSFNWDNGNYTLYFQAYDLFDKHSTYSIKVQIHNDFWHNPNIVQGLITVGVMIFLFLLWISITQKHR